MNKARGEILVELGDLSFVACATVGAVARIEGRVGMTVPRLMVEKLSDGSYAAALAILEETCADEGAREKISEAIASPKYLADVCLDILEAGALFTRAGGGGGKKQKGQG